MQKPKIQRPVQREKSAQQRERARCSENECTIQVGEEHLEIVAGSRPALHMLVPISFAAGAVVAFGLLLHCASEGVWAGMHTRASASLILSSCVPLCTQAFPGSAVALPCKPRNSRCTLSSTRGSPGSAVLVILAPL